MNDCSPRLAICPGCPSAANLASDGRRRPLADRLITRTAPGFFGGPHQPSVVHCSAATSLLGVEMNARVSRILAQWRRAPELVASFRAKLRRFEPRARLSGASCSGIPLRRALPKWRAAASRDPPRPRDPVDHLLPQGVSSAGELHDHRGRRSQYWCFLVVRRAARRAP